MAWQVDWVRYSCSGDGAVFENRVQSPRNRESDDAEGLDNPVAVAVGGSGKRNDTKNAAHESEIHVVDYRRFDHSADRDAHRPRVRRGEKRRPVNRKEREAVDRRGRTGRYLVPGRPVPDGVVARGVAREDGVEREQRAVGEV